MPWIAPITGHCDNRGSARCVECHDRLERHSELPIYADNSAFHGARCDSCGKPFPVRRAIDWQPVHVSGCGPLPSR